MKTLRIGIASMADMKARTMAVARGELKPGPDEPKLWFTSIESLARVLSERDASHVLALLENPPAAPDRLVRAAKAGFVLPISNATDGNKRDV